MVLAVRAVNGPNRAVAEFKPPVREQPKHAFELFVITESLAV